MVTEIEKMWQLVAVSQDSVLELRALWPKGIGENRAPVFRHFIAANYSSKSKMKEAVQTAALDLNRQGFNVYIVMNPIRSDFTGPGCARDTDIIYRDLLLIDIDRLGDTSQPANQEELDEANALARVIEQALSDEGWGQPIKMMSGNGFHLYFVLDDVPNDEESTALIRDTLLNLAEQFNTATVGIDTTVSNASRITKVPGTIMRKGIETADRPYRMARVVESE
jgi:hypothetical protein